MTSWHTARRVPKSRAAGQLIAAKRTPAELAALVDRVEANVRANVATLRHSLGNQGAESDLREVFLAMFPHGLTFEPTRTPDGSRQIWLIRGDADFAAVTGQEPVSPVSFSSRPLREELQTKPGVRMRLDFLALSTRQLM